MSDGKASLQQPSLIEAIAGAVEIVSNSAGLAGLLDTPLGQHLWREIEKQLQESDETQKKH